MPKTVYVCEYCHTAYPNRMDARWCEILHEHKTGLGLYNERVMAEIKRLNQNPCDYCRRAYYVYGSEWNCDCQKNCHNFSLFIAKENENGDSLVN